MTTSRLYIDPDGVSDVCRSVEAILSRIDGSVYEATGAVRRTIFLLAPRGPHAQTMQRGIADTQSSMDALTSQQARLDDQVRAALATMKAVAEQARRMQAQLRSQATVLGGSSIPLLAALWNNLSSSETGVDFGDRYDIVSPFFKDTGLSFGTDVLVSFWGEKHHDARTLGGITIGKGFELLAFAGVTAGVAAGITAGLAAAGIAAPAIGVGALAIGAVALARSLYATNRLQMRTDGENLQREGAIVSAKDGPIGKALSTVGKNYITTYSNMNYDTVFKDAGMAVVDARFGELASVSFHNQSIDSAIGFSTAQDGLKPGESLLGDDLGQIAGDTGRFLVSPIQRGVNEIASTSIEGLSDINTLARNCPLPSPIKSGLIGATEGAASLFAGVSNFVTNGHL